MPGPPYSNNPYTIAITTPNGSSFNVTSDCLRLSYSRSLADPFTPLRADEGVFEFANFDGSFTPGVNSLVAVGNLISLHYTNVFSLSPPQHAYKGRIKAIQLNPALGQRTTVIEALTDIERLSKTFIDTPLLPQIPVSSLFSEIMSRTTVASYASDLIVDIVDYAWYDKANVVGALNQIVKSGYYTLHCDGAGTVRLRSRYYESLSSPVASLEAMSDLNLVVTGEAIINKIAARSQPVSQLSAISTLAWINNAVLLPASASASFALSYLDPRNLAPTPASSIVPLVSGTDYYAAANSDGSGSDMTAALSLQMTIFGASAVASIYNGGNTAWLTKFQIRGYPLLTAAPLSVRHENSSSQNLYGLYEASFDDMLIANYEFLSDLTASIIGDRSQPRTNLLLELVNEQPLSWVLDVGNILSIRNDFANIQAGQLWSVRGMRHDIDLVRGEAHRVRCELRAPANNQWLILDHDPYGTIDADRILAP